MAFGRQPAQPKLRFDEPRVGRIADFSGGQVDAVNPALLNDNESELLQNYVLDEKGTLKVRPGSQDRFASPFAADPVAGMGAYYKSDGTTRLVMAAGTSLYADKPHVVFNYDAQADWKQVGAYTNLDVDSVPGDVRMLEVMVDGFEDGTFGWWTTHDSGWTIDTTVYKTGTRSAKGTGANQKMVRDLGFAADQLYAKLAVRFGETNQIHYPVILLTPSGTQAQVVVADADGSFKYHSGTALAAFPTTKTYVANTWYVVEVWVRGGTFWVSIDGQSLTTAGLALRDTSNNAVTQVAKVQVQNAGATAATMWVDDVIIDPLAAVFSRASTATKQDGTTVVGVNQPRFEDIKKTYVEDTQADFQAGTLTDVVVTAAGDLKLAQEGVDYTNTATLTADFNGTHSNTQASNDAVILARGSGVITVEYSNYGGTVYYFGNTQTYKNVAQGFKVADARSIDKLGVYMLIYATTSTGGVRLEIVNDSAGVPGSTVYASVDIPATAFTTSLQWITATLAVPWVPQANTQYWLVASQIGTVSYYGWGVNNTSGTYPGGVLAYYDTSWKTVSSADACFRVYQQPYVTSGTYTHSVLDVSSAKTVGSATIVYNTTLPTNTILTVEVRTSTDGGVTWSNWTLVNSGTAIIPKGTDLTNYRVQWRANLSTANTSVTPSLNDVTVSVISAHNTSGNRISPVVPVALLGQAQSSSISWTADVPAGTTVGVEISWDGGTTWLACTSGQALPGISGLNLQTASFKLRESLSTTNTAVTPALQSLTITITSNFGKCLTIQATDGVRAAEILTIPRQALTNTEGSFEKRIALLRAPGTTEQYILDGNGATNRSLVCVVRTDGKVAVRFGNGSTTYELVGTTVLQQGRWYAVGFRWGSSGVALVLNGVLEASTATAPSLALGNILYLGCKADGTCQLDGQIDDFRTSVCARTDTEFSVAYGDNVPLPGDSDTICKFDFDGSLAVGFHRGFWVSPSLDVSAASDKASGHAAVTADVPDGASVAVQSCSSADGVTWSDWVAALSDGTLQHPADNLVRLRLVLTGANAGAPAVHSALVSFDGQPSVTAIKTGLTAGGQYFMGTFNDVFVIVNGLNAPMKYDGEAVSDLGGSPPSASYVAAHKNRLWLLKGSRLYFSDLLNPDSWPVLNFIDIAPNDGTVGTGFLPMADFLVIAKDRSLWLLVGDSSSNFEVRRISAGIGCVAPRSLIQVNDLVSFVSHDGLYFTDLTSVTLASERIRRTWERLNTRRLTQAASHFFRHKLYVAVPEGDSLVNNKVLVLDTIRNAFSVFTGWTVSCWTSFLEAAHERAYFGHGTKGQVVRIEAGTSDNGQPIEAIWQSKAWHHGVPERVKRYRRGYLAVVPAASATTLELSFSADGNPYTAPLLLSVPGSADQGIETLMFLPSQVGMVQAHTVSFKLRQNVTNGGAAVQHLAFEYLAKGARSTV